MADGMTDQKKTKEAVYEKYSGPMSEVLSEHLPVYEHLVRLPLVDTLMPSKYQALHSQYQNFKSKPSDVWIASYPKSGTTWSQELVWTLLFSLEDPRLSQLLTRRSPFFEWDSLFSEGFELDDLPEGDLNKTGVMWGLLQEGLPSPRNIKTHLHRGLLPPSVGQKGAKIVYVCRDPRDLCVSLYYHSIKLDGYSGSFDQFVDLFLADALPWSPFWSHVLSYWTQRDLPNVFFITFEQLKKDLGGALKSIASFLGVEREGQEKGHLSDTELRALQLHLDFKTMQKNPAVNNEKLFATGFIKTDKKDQKSIKFMRKGQVGDHKNHLTKEHMARFHQWTKHALQGSDFPYYQDY